MNDELIRFKKDQKFLVFDYETCSLNLGSFNNKPWQIGFIICDKNKILERYNFLIEWDDLKVSKEAARITGFSLKKYEREKKNSAEVLGKFESFLYDSNYLICGHNALGFDVYIHNIHRKLNGLNSDFSYLDRLLDTNCLARALKLSIPKSEKHGRLEWQYKLLHNRKKGIKTNLKQMCKDYSIDFDESKLHDALYDVEKTYEVLMKLIWEVEV